MRRYFFSHLLMIGILVLGLFGFFWFLESGSPSASRLTLSSDRGAEAESIKPRVVLPRLVGDPAEPAIAARAFFAVFFRGDKERILTEGNSRQRFPIASLSKLFTAALILEKIDLTETIKVEAADLITDQAAAGSGVYRAGETFIARDLLYSALVESNNTAANILARRINRDPAGLAEELSLLPARLGAAPGETEFYNPTGLDPLREDEPVNQASAEALFVLAKYLVKKHPQLLTITTSSQYPLFDADGQFHHLAQSTNELLRAGDISWPATIVGGKTGHTDRAKKNLLLVLQDEKSRGYIVAVVLGVDDHFREMKKLLDWIYLSYEFPGLEEEGRDQ